MSETLIWILGVLVIIVFVVVLLRKAEWKRSHKGPFAVLVVKVPKGTEEEKTVGPIAAEQMFSTIHGILEKRSLFEKLIGRLQPTVSFEMAHLERQIKFYIWFPRQFRNLVEGQIYAQYPDAEIEEADDYVSHAKSHGKKSLAISGELAFTDPDIFPIKRYSQFEDKLTRVAVDPMAALTGALSKLSHPEDQAWLQIIVRPLEDHWRVVFLKCIRILGKGIFGNIEKLQKMYARAYATRKTWPKIIFFPLYFIFWIQGITSGMKGVTGSFLTGTSNVSTDESVSTRHEGETGLAAAADKVTRLLFEVTIRMLYLVSTSEAKSNKNFAYGEVEEGKMKVREIAGAFKQFNIPHLNGFRLNKVYQGEAFLERYRRRMLSSHTLVLNNEELATIYHMPSFTVQTPNIAWVRSRKLEPPADLPVAGPSDAEESAALTTLGHTNFRGHDQTFGIKVNDRRRHIYIIGKTGMGKSTLLENMIFSDIQSGKGVGIVDPHGDLADRVIDFVPAHRTNDVVLFDPSDREFPVAFNMLERVDPTYNTIVASGLVGIFKKLYAESWGPRLEHILRNTILGLLEYPNTTMLGITRILQDEDYRRKVIKKIEDPIVKSFWLNEFEKMDPRLRIEAISPILNKVGQFLSSPIIRNIVGQPQSTLDLRFAMDKKKIIIVNLSKGKIGEDISSLLGSMVITKFQLDAMSRANISEKERQDFYLYVDEFQNFATESFATILSEARKYRLNLTMANQYIEQMPEEVRDAVFGNVGTLVSFQVGFDDAETISGQFGEEVMEPDLVSLPVGHTYLRLLIDGMPTKTFSMTTFPPQSLIAEEGRREKILRMSRERYTTKREIVEDKIKRWSEKILQA